jgi:hypothetical protein
MAIRRESIPSSETTGKKRKSSTTPEGRESRMISLAESLAERQLEDGSASAQVITHYLKLGSTRERLEQQRLAGELDLQKAKIEQLATGSRMEELLKVAINAFRGYQGHFDEVESDAAEDFDGE